MNQHEPTETVAAAFAIWCRKMPVVYQQHGGAKATITANAVSKTVNTLHITANTVRRTAPAVSTTANAVRITANAVQYITTARSTLYRLQCWASSIIYLLVLI